MDEKLKELAMCFELRAPVHIIEEIVQDMLARPDAKEYLKTWKHCMNDSHNNRSKIVNLTKENTVWNLCVVDVKSLCCSLEVIVRIMALTETSPRGVMTIQVSIVEVEEMSFQEQVMTLLSHGCLHPIGRTPRRPKSLSIEDEDTLLIQGIASACQDLDISISGSRVHQNTSLSDKDFQAHSAVRQCAACSTLGAADLFLSCLKCQGVIYCSDKCQKEDSQNSHKMWCATFKRAMDMEQALADLPFPFANVTTSRQFSMNKKKGFLKDCGLLGVGLWCYECQDACRWPEDKLLGESENVYGLSTEDSILQLPPSLDSPDMSRCMANWSDYYVLRSFPASSVISAVLTFSMTLYHIITGCLRADFPDVYISIQQTKAIIVHIIGADKEIDMFQPFLECARLLQPIGLQIHLFGNEIPQLYTGSTQTNENLFFQIHHGLYHEVDHSNIPQPLLAICFNGGLGAYSSYMPTVKMLTQNKVPFYYTDYGLASIVFSSTVVRKSKAGIVSEPRINPFRSPFRMTSLDQNLPRYSNALITYIKPYTEESIMSSMDALHIEGQGASCSS